MSSRTSISVFIFRKLFIDILIMRTAIMIFIFVLSSYGSRHLLCSSHGVMVLNLKVTFQGTWSLITLVFRFQPWPVGLNTPTSLIQNNLPIRVQLYIVNARNTESVYEYSITTGVLDRIALFQLRLWTLNWGGLKWPWQNDICNFSPWQRGRGWNGEGGRWGEK